MVALRNFRSRIIFLSIEISKKIKISKHFSAEASAIFGLSSTQRTIER